MSKRDRARRPGRRPAFREPKPIILVVCEGAVTEPEYLDGFAKGCHNPRVHVVIRGGVGVPKTTVEYAKEKMLAAEKQARREKDDNLRFDQVWCVFDIDDHPNLAEARQMARDNGIELAVSNPCIELWLYLHFADSPGLRHRHELQAMVMKIVSGYDKHVAFADYTDHYDHAVKRAKQLDAAAEAAGETGRNPTTGFWRLTESIRS